MHIRLTTLLLAGLAISLPALAQTAPTTAPASTTATAPAAASPFKTDKERMAYALGLQLGTRLMGVELDGNALAAGIKDAGPGAKPQMSDQDIQAALNMLQAQVSAKADAVDADLADKNQKAGDAFLADNAKKDGVKATASGLQYKVLKSGAGKTPKATDTVSVNYKGTLINGEEFDASKNGPVSFPVNGVIPGWTEALQLMKEGDKWQLVIPAKLAYGVRGTQGGPIGPNEVLVFEVELLQVK